MKTFELVSETSVVSGFSRTAAVLVGAVALVIAGALPASAQITSGSVGGSVKDQQGAVVPGATEFSVPKIETYAAIDLKRGNSP